MSKSVLKNYLTPALMLGLEEVEIGDGVQDLATLKDDAGDVIADIVESNAKQNELHRDCDAVVATQAALEAYHTFLTSALENDGGINNQAAAMLKIGLERYESELGLDGLTPSIEQFGGTSSYAQATTISIESIGEKLEKAWEVIKRILRQLAAHFKDTMNQVVKGNTKLQQRCISIRREINSLIKSKAVSDKQVVTVNSLGKLATDGAFKLDEKLFHRLAGVAHYVTNLYPTNVLSAASEYASQVKNFDPTKSDADQVIAKLSAAHVRVLDSFPGTVVKNKAFSPDSIVKMSAANPGNIVMYMQAPRQDRSNAMELLSLIPAKLRVDMLKDPDLREAPQSIELDVQKLDDLEELVTECVKINTDITTEGSRLVSKVLKASDLLISAGDDLKKRTETMDLTAEQKEKVNAVLRGGVAYQKLLDSGVNGAASYLVRTLNMILSVIQYQVATYKVPDAE